MGAYNTLLAPVECLNCGREVSLELQFKFGNTWQHSYSLGDTLKWGGNVVGKPGCEKVLVEAVSGPCPACGQEDMEYDVLVEKDRIEAVLPIGKIRPAPSQNGYTEVA
jgi:hypothetical protein